MFMSKACERPKRSRPPENGDGPRPEGVKAGAAPKEGKAGMASKNGKTGTTPGLWKGLAAASLLLAAAPAAAQEAGNLDWLAGSWRGAGTMFGQPSEAALDVRPALGGRFVELSYRAGGFEGRAFYSPAGEGRWRAAWFDNRGVTFPIAAAVADRTLTADWGSAETERGRTVYRLLPDGRLEVSDTAAGREFARHLLARTE